MVKEVMVSGKLTTRDMFSYLLYHNYSKLGGILTGVLGIVGLILSPIFFLNGDKISALAFGLVALMYVVITPLDFYSRALRQLKSNPVFKNKMTFTFNDEGFIARLYTGVTNVSWAEIDKVAVSKSYVFIYIKEGHALIVPKSNFACEDDFDIVKEFVIEKGLNQPKKNRTSNEEIEDEVELEVQSETELETESEVIMTSEEDRAENDGVENEDI